MAEVGVHGSASGAPTPTSTNPAMKATLLGSAMLTTMSSAAAVSSSGRLRIRSIRTVRGNLGAT